MLRILIGLFLFIFVGAALAAENTASTAAVGSLASQATTTTECPNPEDEWTTSAGFLPSVAECLHGPHSETPDAKRVALVQDIHIKARSYVWLNKITFWVAITLALSILIWPSFVALNASRKPPKAEEGDAEGQPVPHWTQRATATSAIQTTLAALAALSFAFYGHYKDNQVEAETLMREIIYAQDIDPDRLKQILASIAEMDKGFGFTTVDALNSD